MEDEWVSAKDLKEGDKLTLADGTTATITKTYGEQLDEPVIVYNFEVSDFHTYYVTDTEVLVHNVTAQFDTCSATSKRNSSGTVSGSGDGDVSRMMRGKQGNIGLIPTEIADKMNGRTFDNFKDFRSAFWKEVADSSYASEFSKSNVKRMRKGYAPRVAKTQQYGGHKSYILHHRKIISSGGGVYDLNNLVIVTPPNAPRNTR